MKEVEEAAAKIKNMEVRGAAKIAKFAAKTLMDFANRAGDDFDSDMKKAAETLINTRPTAVSLYNAVNYVMNYNGRQVDEKKQSLVSRAEKFIEWVDIAHGRIGNIGSRRIKDNSLIMTHCNSSAALSVIKSAHQSGKNIEVMATESRPRLQGHITVKELTEAGIPTTLIVDSAVRHYIESMDYVIVGADTIAANGALINKIGTSQIALSAKEARVPFMVAAETYKFSPRTLLGEPVEIEERDKEEVAPPEIMNLPGLKVKNPAFDITPRDYIDVIITEIGNIPPEMAYLVIKDKLGHPIFEE
ncbi:MAG: ribose 1,5-bisphosphate isomerase [Archaeoglobaceae archaeon]